MIIAADGEVIAPEHVPAEIRPPPADHRRQARSRTDSRSSRRRRSGGSSSRRWSGTTGTSRGPPQALGLADHASLLKIMRRHGIRRPGGGQRVGQWTEHIEGPMVTMWRRVLQDTVMHDRAHWTLSDAKPAECSATQRLLAASHLTGVLLAAGLPLTGAPITPNAPRGAQPGGVPCRSARPTSRSSPPLAPHRGRLRRRQAPGHHHRLQLPGHRGRRGQRQFGPAVATSGARRSHRAGLLRGRRGGLHRPEVRRGGGSLRGLHPRQPREPLGPLHVRSVGVEGGGSGAGDRPASTRRSASIPSTGRACSTPPACCWRPAVRVRRWSGSSARWPSSRSRVKASACWAGRATS